MPADPRSRDHCPNCGSHIRQGERTCAICGHAAPHALGVTRSLAESALVVGAVLALVTGAWWVQRSGDAARPGAGAPEGGDLVSALPTDMPSSTPGASPTGTLPVNTPFPATPTPLPETVTHVVASGDTLYGIAAQYGVPADAIIEVNGLDRPDALSIGQQLLVPMVRPGATATDDIPAVADAPGTPPRPGGSRLPVPAGAVGPTSVATTSAEPIPTGEPVVLRDAELHVVGAGDTLGGIADEYGLPVDDLLRLNGDWLTDPGQMLQVGDEVVVRAAEIVTATPEPRPPSASSRGGAGLDAVPVPHDSTPPAEFPAPLALAPVSGVVVGDDAPLLRWSSAGLLPSRVYYVVAIREVGAPDDDVDVVWVTSNATAFRVPGSLRPALGSSRELEWSVSVRRRAGGLLSGDRGVRLGPDSPWQRFTWTPGRAPDATSTAP